MLMNFAFLLIALFYYFYCFWLSWVLIAVHELSLIAGSGATLLIAVRCLLFALQWLLVDHRLLSVGFSSNNMWVQDLGHSGLVVWKLPGPGIELVSPALVGGFLTTGPPGKSQISVF